MSQFEFLDSETQDVSKTLLIGLAGATGSGKTESGIRIGLGLAHAMGGELAIIDTENKRALNKKSRYRFKHLDMQPPYSPENYQEAIQAAIDAGFKAIFVDSFSHEWDGDGGLSEDADAILQRISKGDAAKAERMVALSWKEPKQRHKRLMNYLRKCDVPIIFGLRAEPKIKFVKEKFTRNDGSTGEKTSIVDAGWLPIAEKMFGFDMLIYALMMPEHPGVPVHIKELEPDFAPMFPVGSQITEEAGRMLAAWAKGTDWPKEIDGAESLDALAKVWRRVPRTMQPTFLTAKDTRKAKLETLRAQAETGPV
jgi:ABC-type oligopeptide transport system ATPase subunit